MTRTVALLILCFAAGCGDDATVVLVAGPDGAERLTVEVEIASTIEERTRGLQGRTSLGPKEGLLIVLPASGEVCIVNNGVVFSIDAVFVSDSFQVVAIERQVAADDPTARCHEDTRYVLEVAEGVAGSVSVGDDVAF